MPNLTFKFTAKLWVYSGKGAWHFVTLPAEVADGIRFMNPHATGFRPLPVKARIGATTWKTSVFPDSKSRSFLLAVKAAVRATEGLAEGDEVDVWIDVAGGGG